MKVRYLSLAVAVCFFLTGCATGSRKPLQRFEFSSPHMGALFDITLYARDEETARSAADEAFQRVASLENVMSDYDPESELMRLCAQPNGTPVRVSDDLFAVLDRAQKYSRISEGAFDVTVGPYVRLWRFSRKRGVLPLPEELAQARSSVGWQNVELDHRTQTVTLLAPNMRLDLGGIGKGFAADEALEVLKGRGLSRALVAASGDLAIGNPPPGRDGWRIGIAPVDAEGNQIQQTVLLHNAGVSTSGDSEQFVEIDGVRYSHDVDPATGLGLTNRMQVTVIAADATTSDAMCKAILIPGRERGFEVIDSIPDTAALMIVSEGGEKRVFTSRRWARITGTERDRVME